jgi:hypothetical protein
VIPRRIIGRLRHFPMAHCFFCQVLFEVLAHLEMLIRVNGKIIENPRRMTRKSGRVGNKELFPNLRLHPTPCGANNVRARNVHYEKTTIKYRTCGSVRSRLAAPAGLVTARSEAAVTMHLRPLGDGKKTVRNSPGSQALCRSKG